MLRPVLGHVRVHSCERLAQGATNCNVLVRLHGGASAVVLRLYATDRGACAREATILRAMKDSGWVPQILGVCEGANALVYRYLDGMTFRDVKAMGDRARTADAAATLGVALASLGKVDVPAPALAELTLRSLPAWPFSPNEAVCALIGDAAAGNLHHMVLERQADLQAMACGRSLVHGDFNSSNAIFARADGRWRVAGIIDWENACIGSPLWDAARFLCYEDPAQPCREPFFSAAYRAAGGFLPGDWPGFRRLVNILSAIDGLLNNMVQLQFVGELTRYVKRACAMRDSL